MGEKFWENLDTLVSRYIWGPIWTDDAYIPSSLLSLKDKNKQTPGIFVAASAERGPGKTTSFTYKLLRDYFDSKGACKFGLLVKAQCDTPGAAEGILNGTLSMFFPEYAVKEVCKNGGAYSYIYLVDKDGKTEHCGFVLALSGKKKIKTNSSKFIDVYQCFMDEILPAEDWEIEALETVMKSIGRGHGQHARVVPVYMATNTMSVINSYFIAFDIYNKIKPETKKLRGDGIVFERADIDGLRELHQKNPVNRALRAGRKHDTIDTTWINDNYTNVIKNPKGWGSYIYHGTLAIGTKRLGVKWYPDVGHYMIDYRIDPSANVFRMTADDGEVNLPVIKGTRLFKTLKAMVDYGNIYFASIMSKKLFMECMR